MSMNFTKSDVKKRTFNIYTILPRNITHRLRLTKNKMVYQRHKGKIFLRVT